MSIRTLAARVAVAAALLAPALPGHAAPDDEPLTVRLAFAAFKGKVTVKKGTTTRTATISANLTDCTVVGLSGRVPFVNNCVFSFETGTAALSRQCSGSWVHSSHLTIFEPTGTAILLGYDPTVTNVVEGDGTGHGVSALPATTKVNYVIVSLCAALDDSPETEAEIFGSVTAAY